MTFVADPWKCCRAIERPLRARLLSLNGIYIKKKLRRADKLMINVLRRKYEAEKIEKKKNLIFY